jgi:fermentation-respiration switch protein FrsA (DUF1100 family)
MPRKWHSIGCLPVAIDERARLWIVPEAGHTDAFSRYPDEYERRVIEFFESTWSN